MKLSKKVFILLFVLAAVIGLASCRTGSGGNNDDDKTDQVAEYVVTFDSKEGSVVPSQQIQKGNHATRPTDPTREGYNFKGWYKDSACTEEWKFSEDVVTGNVTLYAKWESKQAPQPIPEKKYSITYVSEHGTTPTTVAEATILPTTLPTVADVEGWHFIGWYLEDTFETEAIPGTTLTANITLYAKWEAKQPTPPVLEKFNVKFESDGAVVKTVSDIDKDAFISEPTDITKDGYTLEGWYNGDVKWDFLVDKVTENITLVAHWVKNEYEITFESAYGILPAPLTASTLPNEFEALTDSEHVFEGWYLDRECSDDKKAVPGAEISGPTTLYAKWRQKTMYDTLIEEPQFIVLNNDFNRYSSSDKISAFDNSWNGEAGLYEGTGKSSSSNVDPSPTTTYIKLGNGIADLIDTSDGASVNMIARFGNLTQGTVEGYFEVTLKAHGNSWTFFQLNGTNSTVSSSEIFGIRLDSNVLKYRLNGSKDLSTPQTSIPAADTTYKIYFLMDLDLGTITVTVNDAKFVTDLNIGVTSVVGFKLTSSDGGSKTMSIDNVAVKNMNLSLDEYKALVKQNAENYLANLNVNQTVKDSCQSILNATKQSIDAKTTIADVKKAYNDYVVNITSQVLAAQKEELIAELNSYVDKNLYTYENLNKKALTEAIATGTTNINAATTYNAAVNALNAAKRVIDAIPTDTEQLAAYKAAKESELKVYKDSSDYTINETQYKSALSAGVAAIQGATTIEAVDSALATAKANLDAIDNDAAVLVARKGELIAELEAKADEITEALQAYDAIYATRVANELSAGRTAIQGTNTLALAIKAKNDSAAKMDDILASATTTPNAYKEIAKEILNEYAAAAIVGYEDEYLLDSVQTALANGLQAIEDAANTSGTDAAIKDAITEALETAKDNIDQCIEDFESGVKEAIIKQGQVQITDFGGMNEAIFIEWTALAGATDYQIWVKGGVYSDYTLADTKVAYVQNTGNQYRADLMGLKAGVYSVKVVPVLSGGANEAAATVFKASVEAYDRSGYAHFNYTEGVGAYDDYGVLKDNAIVLYVTDDTKNSVTLECGNVSVSGIGNILNTVGKECGEAGHEGQCKRTSGKSVYYGEANSNADILRLLADANRPLVVRFVGIVSNSGLYQMGTFNANSTPLIEGLTKYDSYNWGGSPGDNGHMARMQSAKNVTLEGVGVGATIDGWGFHFMCQSSNKDYGKSFEVRNLTFINTPEDAIGMEGIQEGGAITASVERCWVHHNEFYCPSISSPAESDKKEGDGSVDFKRGQYFTCSYNYFEGCHKTNLVGSSDSSLQFNLTYHHNYWKYCKARGPLTRQANVHMYNNIFEGQTDYAMNTRANAYIYSEYNLFYMCKSPQAVESGAIKSYNDSFSSYLENKGSMGTVVKDKTQIVPNSCKYGSIDYSKFDTNASQSYIPSGNYILQENVTEAKRVIFAQTGTQKAHRIDPKLVTLEDMSVLSSSVTPVEISTYPSSVTPGKINKSPYAFKLTGTGLASVELKASNAAIICNLAGECLLPGDGVVVLEAGTYIVQPINFQPGDNTSLGTFKEATISSITFEVFNSAEYDAKLIAEYESRAALIPASITYTDSCYQAIKATMNAYAALRDEIVGQITTPYASVVKAYNDYISLGKTRVETLISAIGTVDENSGSAISTARKAYADLFAKDSSVQISNYNTLVAAETAFRAFAVDSFISKVNAIGTVTLSSKEAIELARFEYDSLDDEQQEEANVKAAYAILVAAEQAFNNLQTLNEIDEIIDSANLSDMDDCRQVYLAYLELTADQKETVNDKAKLSQILVAYTEYMINQIDDTITVSSGDAIYAAQAVYESLSDSDKGKISNYSKLEDALSAYAPLAQERVLWQSSTKQFTDTEFTYTNANTGTTSGSTTVMNGSPTILVSKFKVTNLSKVDLTLTVEDKGTTTVTIYYSTDGTNWTKFGEATNGANKKAEDHTITSSEKFISGDVYIKVEGVCTKGSNKYLTIDSLAIYGYGSITY